MARLLRLLDYERAIQSDNLAQIIESNYNLLIDVEQAAQLTMTGHLKQRYQVDKVFSNTYLFNIASTYKGNDLVEYTEPVFSATTVYIANERTSFSGNIYESIAGSVAHAFNPLEWTKICADKSLFYVTLPNPSYNNSLTYQIGDVVFYNDYTYTCLQPVSGILPTNTNYWLVGASYSVTGILPTDISKWTLGDNRNQEIVQYLIDITLYNLHCRINPRNVPELRKERYDGNIASQIGGAIGWLKNVSAGKVYVDIPEILPSQGNSITWGNANGSSLATINMY
jgi:hypothetical protein